MGEIPPTPPLLKKKNYKKLLNFVFCNESRRGYPQPHSLCEKKEKKKNPFLSLNFSKKKLLKWGIPSLIHLTKIPISPPVSPVSNRIQTKEYKRSAPAAFRRLLRKGQRTEDSPMMSSFRTSKRCTSSRSGLPMTDPCGKNYT